MTKVTFGVSASSFAANMAVKRNALDFAMEHSQAAEVVKKSSLELTQFKKLLSFKGSYKTSLL